MKQSGRIEAIYLYPEPRAAGVPVSEARVQKGRGLDGDHDRHPWRQITVLSAEAWQVATGGLGDRLPPDTRRANVVVSGINLEETTGRRLRLGEVELEIGGETKPCQRMDEAREGLRAALQGEWRGGVFGHILTAGRLAVGDPADLT